MKDTLSIALAQCNFLVGDIEGNARQIITSAIHARDHLHADVVVFSELSITGYPLEDLLFRPGILKRVEETIEIIKQEINGIHLLLGAPTKEDDKLFNSALHIYESAVVAIYHKQKLPNYEVFDEKRYFQSGQHTCVTTIENVNVGITICEDIWYPDPIRKAAAAGAEVVININASPYCIAKTSARTGALQARVTEQNMPIIYVNQVGGQDELVFDGESLCINRQGEVCLQAPAFEEGIYIVNYSKQQRDLTMSDCIYRTLPRVASVYQAIKLGVKDYVLKNRFNGIILGLSGGIDSALTLAIAVDALGADQVHAIMMPFRYTSSMSIEDARLQTQALGVVLDEIPIEAVFAAITHSLKPIFSGISEDVTEENIQSRIRGLLLMAISNKTGKMLLTTGNKSEMSVGYATLYGDMAGGFAPIKDVSKTLVYELARHRNTLGAVIPERVITRPPSAELALGQVDEDSLPPYEILDPILEKFIEQDQTIDQIVSADFDRVIVQRVVNMVLYNEYKRRQAPPGVRITRRAFGKDRRHPMTSGFLRQNFNE